MTESTPPKPNFFVVGAPKCGTTSLCDYLSQHPEIFVSNSKEPLFFCADEGHYGHNVIREYDKYLECFSGADTYKRVGEGSVWYLQSEKSPKRIYNFNPESKILIMLRNPVDMVFSLHGQFLFSGNENIRDFEAAYAASALRKQGKRIPWRAHFPKGLIYTDVGCFADSVEKYLKTFGENNVKILLFEEMTYKLELTYKEVLNFLDVDASFRPVFDVKNSRRYIRSVPFQRFLQKSDKIWEPTRWLSDIWPVQALEWRMKRYRRMLLEKNIAYDRPEKVNPDLRGRLHADFAEDIERLSRLIGKDLSIWEKRNLGDTGKNSQ